MIDNEKNFEEKSQEQTAGSRDGYQSAEHSGNNFQREYRPGRSPRPRIHTGQPRPYGQERPAYNRNSDEGAFRPEGFAAGLQSSAPRQQGGYRPRPQGGYQPRPQGGYQPRQQGGYQPRQQGDYQPRQSYGQKQPYQSYNKPYSPRPYNQDADQGGYQPRQQSGYRPYGNTGYRSNSSQYNAGRPARPYNNNGGFGPKKPFNKRPRTADYDPNAKYSMKKRIEYKEEHFDPDEPIRLNKYLANAGVCSRREADEFIQAGVVTVNGEVVTELGTKVLRTDVVRFHEDPVSLEKKVYVLLNKPKDYVTTSDDPQQRKTVMDLVRNACPERIYPVGRLDRNTTGVLLLTNDGDLASKLTHPKFLKKKIYHVYLDKNVTAHDLQQIAEGITLDDGEIKADDIQYADPVDKKQVGIEIHSGKNRIVRRIFESLGYKVTKLDRVQFAGLTKKNLRRGDWRYLTEEEVDRLRMGAYE